MLGRSCFGAQLMLGKRSSLQTHDTRPGSACALHHIDAFQKHTQAQQRQLNAILPEQVGKD